MTHIIVIKWKLLSFVFKAFLVFEYLKQKFFFMFFEQSKINPFFFLRWPKTSNIFTLAIRFFQKVLNFFLRSLDSFWSWVISSFPYCFGKGQESKYLSDPSFGKASPHLERVSIFIDITSKYTKYTKTQANIWSNQCKLMVQSHSTKCIKWCSTFHCDVKFEGIWKPQGSSEPISTSEAGISEIWIWNKGLIWNKNQ